MNGLLVYPEVLAKPFEPGSIPWQVSCAIVMDPAQHRLQELPLNKLTLGAQLAEVVEDRNSELPQFSMTYNARRGLSGDSDDWEHLGESAQHSVFVRPEGYMHETSVAAERSPEEWAEFGKAFSRRQAPRRTPEVTREAETVTLPTVVEAVADTAISQVVRTSEVVRHRRPTIRAVISAGVTALLHAIPTVTPKPTRHGHGGRHRGFRQPAFG